MAAVEVRIKQRLTPKQLLYKPCAVVMGRIGAGKTTLINRLCGTKHEAHEGRGSITRNLYRNDVNRGDNPFSLIDTPGTNSSTETYKHAILLRESLTATNINTIFIVIKYDSRFDQMIDNYFEVEQPVYNYTSKVVVIISHWDQSKNPQNSFREICELFEEECPKVNNLIFCSEKSSRTKIANLMFSCESNMKEERLDINDTDFFLKFNVYQMKSQMKTSFSEYQNKANALVQEYAELIISVESASVEDKDEVLHMTIVKFKDETDTLLQEFRQQHESAMQELDYYVFYIKMEKENVRICDEFVKKVVPLMSYNLFDNQDPRNLIKRCPHCHLIWFKTEGCDGTTTCGNNEFSKPTTTFTAFWKYQVKRIGGKLMWEKNEVKQNNSHQANEDLDEPVERRGNNHSRQQQLLMHSVFGFLKRRVGNAISETVGCGKEFRWSELPKIEDDLILELFKVKTIDQAKQMIQNGSFTEARRNYESNVDRTFLQ